MLEDAKPFGSTFLTEAKTYASPQDAKSSFSYKAFQSCGYKIAILPIAADTSECVIVAFLDADFMGFGTG